MIKSKNPHPAGGTAEQGEYGAVWADGSHNSDSTSAGAGRQGRIFPLLLEGEAAALPASDLAKLAGFKNERTMRAQIDRERANGALILASEFGYAMQTGQEELFSLDDVAAALGCTKEEAAAEMERHGIQGMTISTLPGFEWLLDKM